MRPELHPACAAFPPLPDSDLRELAADIRQRGLLEPITLTADGLLLDGRCRWDACETVGVEPRTVTYDGNDPASFALSKNKHRRHYLDTSQMAMVIARLVNIRQGNHQHGRMNLINESGASRSYVDYARQLLKLADPIVIGMVDAGRINLRVAIEAARANDRATQATWSEADVEREGKKAMARYPSRQPGAQRTPRPAKAQGKAPTRIHIPYDNVRFPTAQQTGYPVNGTLKEKDAFCEAYGRTPLHPMDIRHLNDALAMAGQVLSAIINAGSTRHCDAATFLAHIEQLKGRKPQHADEINYAARGRRIKDQLKEALPRAYALVTALHDALETPVQPPAEPAPEQLSLQGVHAAGGA